MILLKKHNLLFLKPRKVAGTSFEIALSAFASKEDIVAKIPIADEEIRKNLGFQGPTNDKKTFKEKTIREKYRTITQKHEAQKFYDHITPEEIIKRLGKKKFQSLYKVSIVRNPYDVLVSLYYFRTRGMKYRPGFEKWARQNPNDINGNLRFYFHGETPLIDHLIRYEHLQKDTKLLEKNFPALTGLSELLSTINAKGGIRPPNTTFNKMYENDTNLRHAVLFYNMPIFKSVGYPM